MSESKSNKPCSDELGKIDDKDIPSLLQQYRAFIDSREKLSDRRADTNKFFITLITGLFALLSLVARFGTSDATALPGPFVWPIGVIGILLCYVWYATLITYDVRLDSRREVIINVERHLPYQMYKEYLCTTKEMGKKLRYRFFGELRTDVEKMAARDRWIAALFGIIFFVLAAASFIIWIAPKPFTL